ncbi:hypothetical protein [Flavobacterium sp.]|uniref:hypothetical protein n=1 Tax=Flavobacterium sp. TaxID=239 RepID=UPI0035299196
MELEKVKILLEKYFEGQTSLAEETFLRNYFSSEKVATSLEKYKPLFINFNLQKEEKFNKPIRLPITKSTRKKELAIAASILLAVSAFLFFNTNHQTENLGTFSSPEEAFLATQQALQMIAVEVNKGKESVAYLHEYEQTKQTIFK